MLKRVLAFCFAAVGLPLMVLACDGDPESDDPDRLVAACKDLCAAITAPACSYSIAKDQCDYQCAYVPIQLDGFCIAETADAYECLGKIEYTCMEGTPVPADGTVACLNEQQAANTCLQDLPCKKYCAAADESGCGGPSCESACESARPLSPFCEFEYQILLDCQTDDIVCDGSAPGIGGCTTQRDDLVTCLVDDGEDPCGAYCWKELGGSCMSGTVETCRAACSEVIAKGDENTSCYFELQDLRVCETAHLTCEGGKPVLTAGCESQQAAYEMCATGG